MDRVYKVLIIDDDRWIAMSTAMVLEAEGFQVESALGGIEGAESAVRMQPDIILLDIMMPGMDGWETLERLKADPRVMEIPVVLLTAREYPRGNRRCEELGAVEYFRKPFRPEALLRTIRRHIGEEHPQH